MGLYYTNDMGMLPRYNVGVYTDGLENLMSIPTAFNTNDNLFMCLNTQNPYVGYRRRPYDYSTKWGKPSIYDFDFHMIVEGDDDEVIAECEDYVFGKEMPEISKIDDIKQHLPDNVDIDINEFDYVTLEGEVTQAIKDNAIISMLRYNSGLCDQETFAESIKDANEKLKKFCNELGVDVTYF